MMKWCPLLVFSLFLVDLFGQSKEPDSATVNHLIDLSKKAQWIDSYQSLNYADQALELAQQIHYKKGIVTAFNLQGFCFWTFGDNDLAIRAAMEALELAQKESLLSAQAESYYILARGYMDLRENVKAREFFGRAETLARDGDNWELLCSIYNLKGVILFIDNKVDSALALYNKAFDTGRNQQVDSINFPRIISNIGECYSVENPELAFRYFNQALTLAKGTNNKIAEASITDIIGHAYLRKHDLKNAETKLEAALQLAQSLGLRRVIRHAYSGLVDIKLQQGKGDEAVVYLRKFYAVRDSLLNTSKIRQIVELESKHELQLKEQNIKLLESEARIQTMWKNTLIACVFVIAMLSVGLFQWQRYRYRKNREILDLEIDYLTQQRKETLDRYKAVSVPEDELPVESYDQKLLRKAIAFVETNMSDSQLNVEKMAAEMNMSRTSLHRKLKSITGFAPSEFIRNIRLRRASKLILSKADTVSQIAQLVGFDDYSHFSKAFKKHFGVSPSSYEQHSRIERQLAG